MMIHVALDFEIFTGMNYFAWVELLELSEK